MKYLLIEEPFKVDVKEKEKPVPKEGEALLKMVYGGICGTDLSIYRGKFAYVSYPRIPGHEIAAEIVEIGENPQGLKAGDLVTVNPYYNCGKCYSCERGLLNCCMSNETLGAQRDGAYSEYFTAPVERIYSGEGVSAKTLALIEPFCISYHGVNKAKPQKGEKVLVMGAGTIGILAAITAKYFGAKVYVSDISEQKLAYALENRVDGVILNNGAEELEKQVDEITGGCGFDVTIEAVGTAGTFQNCIDSAAFGGRVVLIGISKQKLDFDFTVIQKKELQIYGSRNALKEDFITLIGLVKNREIDVDQVITDVYPMEQMGQALHKLDTDGGDMLKVLLEF